jgi:hypothetical protein
VNNEPEDRWLVTLFNAFNPAFRKAKNAILAALACKILLQLAPGAQRPAAVRACNFGRIGASTGMGSRMVPQ